jgi:dissimilatory sulfite reductase (desulfoviridin) alpha/beta subunit
MTKDEALKLALEALEEYYYGEARIILRQALEQPEQEPVAWEQFHEHLVERNFCPRCGKRTADLTTIHTCTPPHDNALQRGLSKTKEVVAGSQAFYGFPHGPVSTPNAGGKCVTAGETAPKEST